MFFATVDDVAATKRRKAETEDEKNGSIIHSRAMRTHARARVLYLCVLCVHITLYETDASRRKARVKNQVPTPTTRTCFDVMYRRPRAYAYMYTVMYNVGISCTENLQMLGSIRIFIKKKRKKTV
jgi:hypothetical protein